MIHTRGLEYAFRVSTRIIDHRECNDVTNNIEVFFRIKAYCESRYFSNCLSPTIVFRIRCKQDELIICFYVSAQSDHRDKYLFTGCLTNALALHTRVKYIYKQILLVFT